MTNPKEQRDAASSKKSARDFDTIFGREIEVTYKPLAALDEAEITRLNGLHELFGKTEKIKLKEIARADIPKYYELSTAQNEPALANLIARKPLDSQWSNLLNTESFDRVLDTGQEINLPLLSAWFRRTMKRNEALMPGSADIATKAIAIIVDRMMSGKEAAKGAPSPSLSPPTP